MPIYTLTLVNKTEVARNTYVFDFTKPDNFTFTPGQYGGWTLLNTKVKIPTRRFSIVSAPEDPLLSFVTRIQNSDFKQILLSLPLTSEIKFAGPTGIFTLHEDLNIPSVLIAGGIGIAPFYSMIRHTLIHEIPRDIVLLYGNQTFADTAFLKELNALQQQHFNFRLIPTFMTPESNWEGDVGFITDDMIYKNVADLATPYYYVCGSPAMVKALHQTLKSLDIKESQILVEDFPGY